MRAPLSRIVVTCAGTFLLCHICQSEHQVKNFISLLQFSSLGHPYFSWVNNGSLSTAWHHSCWCKSGYTPVPKPGVMSGDCTALSSSGAQQLLIPGVPCYTNAGDVPNSPCVTGPWKYQGVLYEGCANAGFAWMWCPTEVTANGDYITGKWGACDMTLDACLG